ncbi:hypothetical protein B0H10DRAFT_1961037 [Mycena sp. CBHHK59/15]|nr:hypothetical protein B0H10DRAFT_1961037 [Mycena sp. CBHHK59/15]
MSRGSTREPSVSKTRNSRMTWVSVIFWSSSRHSVGTGQVLMSVSVSVGGHLRFEDPEGKSNGIVFTVLGNKPFVYFRFGNGGLEFFESHEGKGEVRSKCRLWGKHARSNDLECVFRFIESFLLWCPVHGSRGIKPRALAFETMKLPVDVGCQGVLKRDWHKDYFEDLEVLDRERPQERPLARNDRGSRVNGLGWKGGRGVRAEATALLGIWAGVAKGDGSETG